MNIYLSKNKYSSNIYLCNSIFFIYGGLEFYFWLQGFYTGEFGNK